MDKLTIKLVVLNGHTLGYIDPRMPKYVYHLRALISKGAPANYNGTTNTLTSKRDEVRMASEQDFEDFGVSMEGYKNDNVYNYEYASS